jgi:hypothetical protein
MEPMSNGHQFRLTHRLPRGAGTRAKHAPAAGGRFSLAIVNFVNFAARATLPPLSLRAA